MTVEVASASAEARVAELRQELRLHEDVDAQDQKANKSPDIATIPNGLPSQQARASPSVPIPNGKPTSPYPRESTPVAANPPQTISSKDPKAAAAAANEMRNVVRRKLTGYVGFANLPNQWHRKSVRKGFSFNVMVVGECTVSCQE